MVVIRGGGSTFLDKIDMKKIVLVGHSRGGEGINCAMIDSSKPTLFKIVGLVVSYGPTAFSCQVTPQVHSATILPICDGDIEDLQGQTYVLDGSRDIAPLEALWSAVIAVGCNHNYYFNTEWTPGLAQAPANDDWWDSSDSRCGSKNRKERLTAAEQQKVGSAYTLALVRLAVKKDSKMLQFLDGSYVKPKSIGRADIATNAVVGGALYRLLYRPEDVGTSVILRNGMTGGDCCRGVYYKDSPLPRCDLDLNTSPHWLTRFYDSSHPTPQASALMWTKTGASAQFNIRTGPVNLEDDA